jgi:peptide/nickel transport system ATP-binding protein/oligopeptide transport system ATP-binding protein
MRTDMVTDTPTPTQPSAISPNGGRERRDKTKSDVLLEVDRLVKFFPVRGGLLQRTVAWVKAVDDVSFFIRRGETLGLVGESGCGKTTVGRTLLRLIPATSGQVRFEGKNIFDLKSDQLKRARRDIQIIFQDPFSSLDPRIPIGESIAEGLLIHGVGREERMQRVQEVLSRVGLLPEHAKRYPHEFSGGQRQRIGIARALALRPKFIVCDEPVSALDVSIQSQVLNILKDLQDEYGLTYLFIAHNLSVVEHISDRVGVMYLGKMAELADRNELFENPQHPYTHALLSAIPIPDPRVRRERIILKGDVPSPLNPPSGCRFHTRCWLAQDICKQQVPAWRNVAGPGQVEHFVACHFAPFTKMPMPGESGDILGKDETTVVTH